MTGWAGSRFRIEITFQAHERSFAQELGPLCRRKFPNWLRCERNCLQGAPMLGFADQCWVGQDPTVWTDEVQRTQQWQRIPTSLTLEQFEQFCLAAPDGGATRTGSKLKPQKIPAQREKTKSSRHQPLQRFGSANTRRKKQSWVFRAYGRVRAKCAGRPARSKG